MSTDREGIIVTARRQGYRNGYAQAKADARALVTEVLRATSEHCTGADRTARIEALRHVRAALAAMSDERGEGAAERSGG